MYYYRAYGLRLCSEVAFPGFPRCEERGGDVTFFRGDLATLQQRPPDGGNRIFGYLCDELAVLVEGGTTVQFHAADSLSEADLVGYLTGIVLATLLRQRGLLVLHASAAARDGETVAFMGNSGWGKSTLAEALLQRGYEVLTDDILVLGLEGDKVVVRPGPAYIRLREGAGKVLLREGFDALPAITKGGEQRLRAIEPASDRPFYLRGLYVLDPNDHTENEVVALDKTQGLLALLTHSWGKYVFSDSSFASNHLALCAAVCERVRPNWLRRVRSLDALPEHLALVEASAELQPVLS